MQRQNISPKIRFDIISQDPFIQCTPQDLILQEFTKQEIQRTKLIKMFKYQKPLDNQIMFLQKIVAWVLFIPQTHSFIVIETNNFYISVDYYNTGIVKIKICKEQKQLFNCTQGQRRRQSSVVKDSSGGQPYISNIADLTVRDLFVAILKAAPSKQFNKMKNNCHTFATNLWDNLFAMQKFTEKGKNLRQY